MAHGNAFERAPLVAHHSLGAPLAASLGASPFDGHSGAQRIRSRSHHQGGGSGTCWGCRGRWRRKARTSRSAAFGSRRNSSRGRVTMTASPSSADRKTVHLADQTLSRGSGGELHQTADDATPVLTTNQGIPVSDDQNSLRPSPRIASLAVSTTVSATRTARSRTSRTVSAAVSRKPSRTPPSISRS